MLVPILGAEVMDEPTSTSAPQNIMAASCSGCWLKMVNIQQVDPQDLGSF